MRRLYRLTASWALCLSWVLLICSAQPQTFLRPLVQTSLQGVTWILDQNYSLPEGDTRRPQCEMQMEFRLLFVQPLGFQAAMQMINNLKEPVYAWQVGFEFASPSNVTISHVTEGIQLPTTSEFLAATDAAAQAAQTALVASLRGTDEASLVQPITQGGAADTTAPSQAPAPAPIPDGSVDFSELALTESLSQQAASGIADSALANAPLVSAFEGPPAQLLPLATPAPVVEAVSQQATSSPDPTATQQSVNSPGSPTGMAHGDPQVTAG
ncbi:hypothetical protein WJX72_007302 [[Myrmecia] bisecta]|uniref:Uncharacterized protein n=1 Tax=[Myrmecia] bisecta TaxID=41462 RepID=A0AAW1QFM0_9CHLO